MIKKIDNKNMFKSIWNFPENILDAIELGQKINFNNKYLTINKIIIAGMGGSAIGGDVAYSLVKDEIKIPYFVLRGYEIPSWVDSSTLVICSSYSGNTEETISILEKVRLKNAMVCSITTGGKIQELCEEYNYDKIVIPSEMQPRSALAFSFIPILYILYKLKIISSNINPWLKASAKLISSNRKIYIKNNDDNPIWVLANKIYDKLPIIYADSERLETVAVRIKGQICENSKMLAYHNIFPEMNHNEIVGWENNSNYFSNYYIIWLYDSKLISRNRFRQKIITKMLTQEKVNQFKVQVSGNSFKERFLLLIHYGDWLSYWCAILHKTDPSPVKKIQLLKNKLSKLK